MTIDEEFDLISVVVDEHVDLLRSEITGLALVESRDRATKFLVAQAMLVEFLRKLDKELITIASLRDATYADAIGASEGKNVTEKKINVSANKNFVGHKENAERIESLRDWVKGHIKIFENAHIMYRGFSREG